MKCMSAFYSLTIVCLSASFVTATLPAQAQWMTDNSEDAPVESVNEDASRSEVILLEAPPTSLLTEDASILNQLADQINQGMGGPSDDFLPDGMVVRGSNSSLQLGSEL
ncbi:MAG: hypothetical protein VKJ64_18120 [Leptolyngbyaceae bacterium]|nr:hypothetical protein [Leptolyngbyaceae bacterium]